MPVPTAAMAEEARRGLAWRQEHGRGGTEVGVARARDISNRKNMNNETIGRMVSYFARHEVDKQGQGWSPGEDGYPSAGRIAWALWGGEPGKIWANKEWAKIQGKGAEIMTLRKHITLTDVQLKFASGNAGTFSGYASVFGGVDSYSDTILPGAYKSVIERIMDGAARMPKMFVNHRSWELPVGKWTSITEDDKGLRMEGELTPGNPQAAVVKAAMQHETVDGLSIGYMLREDDVDYIKGDDGDRIRVIRNISELSEVSIVTYPADDAARVDLSSVKSALEQIHSIKDFEDFLREAGGFSKGLATATASRAKRIFAQSESEPQLPDELQRLIAENLKSARTL